MADVPLEVVGSISLGDTLGSKETPPAFCSYCDKNLLENKGGIWVNVIALQITNKGEDRIICHTCLIEAFDTILTKSILARLKSE